MALLHGSLSSMGIQTADVVILSNMPKVLTYLVPETMDVQAGFRVQVPVRKSVRVGIVLSLSEIEQTDLELKDLGCILDERPFIPGELIELVRWTSKYYHAGLGPSMALAMPPYLRQGNVVHEEKDPIVFRTGLSSGRLGDLQKALLETIPESGIRLSGLKAAFHGLGQSLKKLMKRKLVELRDIPAQYAHSCSPAPEFTPDQITAAQEIREMIATGRFHIYVLHGITGSGKTEVYLSTAQEVLGRGRSVLYLVPEIALTPQTVRMVKDRIPVEVAVFHSGLPPRERAREFMKVVSGGARFVLGTRSAIFSPLTDLGLIIVDEEHDHSYKQEEGIPYNARDLSILRARNNHAVVILGSATPSMDTIERTRLSHSSLITMKNRIGPAELPAVEIVDMRGSASALSEKLVTEMNDTTGREEQVLLFINRRGFSAAMVCPGCGKVLKCSRCDRSLTYHKSKGLAVCHWCGFNMRLPEVCPSCGCLDMKPIGLGTEQIMAAVEAVCPGRRILRMDSDEISTTNKLNLALDAIRSREVDIIVGTQMIAKGHDFPHLTLVGVVHAEQLLHMPDFRSSERTFQQIVQVAGRAGRRKSNTKVIIQTLIPDHPLIRAIERYDYQAMIDMEKETRMATGFPPFSHMARCVISSENDRTARDFSMKIAASIKVPGNEILGPAPAPISLLRNQSRWHVILRSKNRGALHRAIDAIGQMTCPKGAEIRIDVDPYSMM